MNTVLDAYLSQRGYKKRDATHFTLDARKCAGGNWIVEIVEAHEYIALLKADSPISELNALKEWALIVA
ncbi:MAG: hypothetical protein ACMV0I_09335 [Pseudomonas sp.]